jgi:tetratricopeptide (TPR) repeat protein
VAALFGLHPLRVESVAWVSERKDVLSAFFGLLTLLFYARYAQKRLPDERVGSKAPAKAAVDYTLALLFFVLALMSKVMLVTLPLVMLLLDYWPLQRFAARDRRSAFRRLILEKVPFFLFAFIVGSITFTTHRNLGALTSLTASPLSGRLSNALVAFVCYLGHTFWPLKLALPYPRVGHWPTELVLLSAALIIGISGATIALRRKQPYLLVGWFWFIGMLIPVSGLIQWGEQSMADRFTYLPSIGFFILLTWVMSEVAADWRVPKILIGTGAALVLAACAIGTRMQLTWWRDTETLFRHALDITQNNYVAYCNLGMSALNEGRLDDAEQYFASALAANPDYAPALNNFGAVLLHHGRVQEAAACIQKSVQLGPYDASAHFNLGQVCLAAGQPEAAVRSFENALQLQPDYVTARENLAAVLIRLGRLDEAVFQLQTILSEKPRDPETLSNLGSALAMKGEAEQAIIYFRQAVRSAPQKPDTHFNLGNALLSQRQKDEAIREYKEALRLKPDYSEARRQLQALGAEAPP